MEEVSLVLKMLDRRWRETHAIFNEYRENAAPGRPSNSFSSQTTSSVFQSAWNTIKEARSWLVIALKQ